MKKLLALALVLLLALSLAAACTVNVDSEKGSGNAPFDSSNTLPASQGADSTPSGGGSAFIPGDKDEVITFRFEDTEHMRAVVTWLKTVLYAEDYYEFKDGEDYDAPYDFDDESPILLDEEE